MTTSKSPRGNICARPSTRARRRRRQTRKEVASDSCSPPLQPSFAVEPAGDETPLQHDARPGREEGALDCLQQRLCNINHRDDAGYCALHEACTRGWLTIVRHLVAHGADVNCSAQDGTRPLHDAVENNHVEVVRFLLACGADPTLTSCSGRGPIDMTGSVAMETFLEEYLADLQGRPEGDSGICWDFYGSSVCEPSTEGGVYNILAHPPGPEEEDETERRLGREEFEIEQPLLPCYTLQVSPATGPRNWLLLRDVLAHLQMTAHTFRRLFPHVEVLTIPEADFHRQTSLSQPCAHPAQRAAKDWLHLVEATPEMSAVLGSSIEFVNNREPPVVSNVSPRPAPPPSPPPSSSPGVPVPPSHASDMTVERTANASSCVTHNQEIINTLEAKNNKNSGPSSKTDSVACEVQHLQNRVTVSTHCGSEEHSQCGEITDAHASNRNSQNEDGEVVGEAFDQKRPSLHDLSGQTVKMDAAWRRHLANVRVHIRDLGMEFAAGRTASNVMDSRKVTESKATQLKNQPGR
ncbi:BCL-6 corepressor-like isoform X2 [Hippocampus zosterae]|uniref:BCL-6 corepressor-like isoform X2 n=1 Tax=Hippocampus zosterae TaxID=109293 RepID=UPI00223CBCD7|nr:BCL-6 corepressor-like isoform X2 [Hippocampus zosterae]